MLMERNCSSSLHLNQKKKNSDKLILNVENKSLSLAEENVRKYIMILDGKDFLNCKKQKLIGKL